MGNKNDKRNVKNIWQRNDIPASEFCTPAVLRYSLKGGAKGNKNDKRYVKNIWQRNNIPALEFCTLPRAAELLKCHINDLIHFCQIGAIELCLSLHDFEAVLFTCGPWKEGNGWERKFPPTPMLKHKNKSPLSLFVPKAEYDMNPAATVGIRRCYQNDVISGCKKPILYLSGLWSLSVSPPYTLFSALKDNEKFTLTAFNFSLKEADIPFDIRNYGNPDYAVTAHPVDRELYSSGWLNEAEVKPIASISVNDLFITRTQIERVIDNEGGIIPSYINGGVTPTPESNKQQQIAPVVNGNKIGDFIKMLILSVPELGEKVITTNANKRYEILRRFLEGKQSEGKFTDMTMPSSATIEKYFKI